MRKMCWSFLPWCKVTKRYCNYKKGIQHFLHLISAESRVFFLYLQSGNHPKCRCAPIFVVKNKRLLIIRMFEKLAGGKDNSMRIIVDVHVMRGRLATSLGLGFRQVPSNGDVTSSTFFLYRYLSGLFRLYGDALITKNVLMQIWLNR